MFDPRPFQDYLEKLNAVLAARHRLTGARTNGCGDQCAVRTGLSLLLQASANEYIKGNWAYWETWKRVTAEFIQLHFPCKHCGIPLHVDSANFRQLCADLNVRYFGVALPAKAEEKKIIVNVAAPNVTVEAPAVTVQVPEQKPPIVNVNVPTPEKRTIKVVERNNDGSLRKAEVT
jgi:hypothetical protein